MEMRKLKKLKYKKERCILSDTLPFEVPIIFNNKNFYNFILKHNINYDSEKKKISWRNSNSTSLNQLVRILFNLKEDKYFRFDDNNCIYNIDEKFYRDTIPYNFKITHHTNVFRALAVPHPLNQLMIIDFYDKYKETILYYCSISSFSLRKPTKIAQYLFYKDKTHYTHLVKDNYTNLEMHDIEYENLRSFFVYEQFSNIHGFYESELFNEYEKRYDNLMKLDISRCFDSIYTHSISWAILGLEQTKEEIRKSKDTFSGHFDKLMQEINYNETNGIIIGPEISRIFAEIILQSIDNNIKKDLEKIGLIENNNYRICRYIDDYFIFYNGDQNRDIIIHLIQDNIRKYKLNLNSSKIIDYKKPIITEISIAKTKISSLLNDKLTFNLEEVIEGANIFYKGNIYINSNNLIKDFKIILKESNVEYKNILNYTLSIIERKLDLILKKYNKVLQKYKKQENLIIGLKNILSFSFFVYTVSPQVSPTIRLCRIIGKILFFIKRNQIYQENKNIIEQFLYENICIILEKNKINQYTQLETIYLLLSISELGKDYLLSEANLASYFNIDLQKTDFLDCHYFVYISVLFYIKNKSKYKTLYDKIIYSIQRKISININKKDTEAIMLLMDVLACPYISKDMKSELLKVNYNIHDIQLLDSICNYKKENGKSQLWFTTWNNFNFLKELYDKQSIDVY